MALPRSEIKRALAFDRCGESTDNCAVSGGVAVAFQPGDRVSRKGFAVPMTVESVDGDQVTVREYDHKRRTWRRSTYNADELQPTSPRRPIRFKF